MKQQDIDDFESLLTKHLKQLLSRAEDTVSGAGDSEESIGDPAKSGAQDVDRDFLLRIRDRERKLIELVRNALQRIGDGAFGVCESCGGDISIERLKARPVTTQCIDCEAPNDVA